MEGKKSVCVVAVRRGTNKRWWDDKKCSEEMKEEGRESDGKKKSFREKKKKQKGRALARTKKCQRAASFFGGHCHDQLWHFLVFPPSGVSPTRMSWRPNSKPRELRHGGSVGTALAGTCDHAT